MIKVKIRDIYTGDSTHVGEFTIADADAFVRRLKSEGVVVVGNDQTWEVQTQWTLDEASGEFFLDIIVGEENTE